MFSFILLFSTVSVTGVQANSLSDGKGNNNFYKIAEIDEKTFNKELEQLIILLEEMDSKGIDIVNLENNESEEINLLSPEAKKLYVDYEKFGVNLELDKHVSVEMEDKNAISTMSSKVNGIFISNDTINKLNKVTGVSGGIFGVAAALIKAKLGLSPTALTALIVAVGALGVAGINACNWNNKGIYLTAEFIGPITMPLGVATCKAAK